MRYPHLLPLMGVLPTGYRAASMRATTTTREAQRMDLHLALNRLAAEHDLDAARTRRLEQLAGLHDEPRGLAHWLPRGVAVLAAALGGLGLIFWIAANWDTLGRFGRFALLQGTVLVMCLGALWRPAARAPLGLMALLAIGGLFAYFGQTYQTGADPWQLFALWAVLALPLCLGVRSDVAWAPWSLVAMTAISLWMHAHAGHSWRMAPQDLVVHLAGWAAALTVCGALSGALSARTGAGPWSLRAALTLALVLVSGTGLAALFESGRHAQYPLAVVATGAAALFFARPRGFDVYCLSAAALAVDTLLICGLGKLLLDKMRIDDVDGFMLLGLGAAGILAATVSLVLRSARAHAAAQGAAA